MDRAKRRHYEQVAKLRVWRDLRWTWGKLSFDVERGRITRHWNDYGWMHMPPDQIKWWRPENQGSWLNHWPRAWLQWNLIRPARVRSNRLLHLIERGREDIDSVDFPDYRKPHVYYW